MAASKVTTPTGIKAAEKKFNERFSKMFGEGSLVDTSAKEVYEVIPTGSITLDRALGVGGWVIGRISELYGQDGIGKTTLALYAVAEAQKKYPKHKVGWIDMEGTLDLTWAAMHGVELGPRFIVYTPESAEDVADAQKEMIRSGLFIFIVVDSIGAMIPESEKEKDADEVVMARQAQIVTRMLKIAGPECRKHGVALLVINQLRANLTGFGKATKTGGGWLLRYCTTHKVELKRTDTKYTASVQGISDQEVGHQIRANVERNKVAPPHKRAVFSLFHTYSSKYGNPGIDRVDEAVTVGIAMHVIQKGKGSWYVAPITGEPVNGAAKLIEAVRAEPKALEWIRSQVLAATASEVLDPEEADTDPIDETGEAKEGDEGSAKKAPAKKAAAKKSPAPISGGSGLFARVEKPGGGG